MAIGSLPAFESNRTGLLRVWPGLARVFRGLLSRAVPGFGVLSVWAVILAAPPDPPPGITDITHTPKEPRSGQTVIISAKAAPGIKGITLEYQLVDPGRYVALNDPAFKSNWVSLPMHDAGMDGDAVADDRVFAATIPESIQTHRRLVRYRFAGAQDDNQSVRIPASKDAAQNFAYFVYNGIPGWSGAINAKSSNPAERKVTHFSPEVMRSVQAYHLIAKSSEIQKATWLEQSRSSESKYTGTLVADGTVHDHVRFRARGGDWRYAMGKNMWKVDFNSWSPLQARDDYGRPYKTKWDELNLRACIQQGDYGHRGEQGLFETVGFKLFNLAGVEAPHTHWIHWRIVSEPAEAPQDQYRGDFWGLYLAIENEDGRFLEEHGLPDGNLYKMKFGTGTLSHQGANAVTNGSDLRRFMTAYQRSQQSDDWWRQHLDLPRYYSYRSILEAIHHYDIEMGKNYDYYFNPVSQKWIVIPWDIDLTWADNMFGRGNEPFKRPVLSRPAFNLEYQNRLREIRDLLFNPEQTGQLIDEYAAIISGRDGKPGFVDADRAKWDYHPIMVSSHVLSEKAGQGLFYQASATGDFAGMAALMKRYVRKRAAFIDRSLLKDTDIPSTPEIEAQPDAGSNSDGQTFRCFEFQGAAQFAAMKWRMAEVQNPQSVPLPDRTPRPYEITPIWESAESTTFKPDITIPSELLKPGRTYRVRAIMKDESGRWSHWSKPAQFIAD
jgi:hypothetical protein